MNDPDRQQDNRELARTALFSLLIGGGFLLLCANLLGAGDSTGLALLGAVSLTAGLALPRRAR